jgi:hypothetical protein
MRRSTAAAAFTCMLVIAALSAPASACARLGVGVNVGRIRVDEALAAGGVYELPPIGVINTGDEPGSYTLTFVPISGQKELSPDDAWFTRTPETFELAPGAVRTVQIRLTLPVNAEPGDYFALASASPVQKTAAKGATIAVAAASKLTFTVKQTNVMLAVYYRVRDVMGMYSPWSWIALGVIAVLAIGIPLARRYRFSFGVERRSAPE